MKTKFFMTLVLVLMGMCSLQAQPGQGRRGPEFPSERLIKELKLTDAQVANIKKDNEELRAQMRACEHIPCPTANGGWIKYI